MKFLFLISFLFWGISSFAQYKNSSRFLYGKSRSKLPYYVGINAGVVTNDLSGNKDFKSYDADYAWGLSFEKPLGYRPSLLLNFRMMGNYSSSTLNVPNDMLGTREVMSRISIQHSYDISISYNYMFLDFRGWQYRAALGIGFLKNDIDVSDTLYRNVITQTTVLPFQITTGRTLYKRLELEIGYRYYFGFNNEIDGIVLNNTYDKYSYYFVGIKYLIGEKDYRFQKKGSCPSVD